MTPESKYHLYAYIAGIVTGIAILYLFVAVMYKLDIIDKKVDRIYAILDITATCEEIK